MEGELAALDAAALERVMPDQMLPATSSTRTLRTRFSSWWHPHPMTWRAICGRPRERELAAFTVLAASGAVNKAHDAKRKALVRAMSVTLSTTAAAAGRGGAG
jgi:hypothetical protein